MRQAEARSNATWAQQAYLETGGTLVSALSLAGDGKTVVGYASAPAGYIGFRWTQQAGRQGPFRFFANGIASTTTRFLPNTA